jgi:hypothetical protein
MATVIFTHPSIDKPLRITTGANQITWGYGLNTAVYPTYGGEVVQVLSAYTDDILLTGDVKNYSQMEWIYRWFLRYMQLATQTGNFVDTPVTMKYNDRGWILKIKPSSLPGFRYGTEVVAPSWSIQAAVIEDDEAMAQMTLEVAQAHGFDFTRLHAGIGYDEDNPFTNPKARKSDYDLETNTSNLSDFYQNLIPSYLDGDFQTLADLDLGSKPAKKEGDGNETRDGGKRDDSQNNGDHKPVGSRNG